MITNKSKNLTATRKGKYMMKKKLAAAALFACMLVTAGCGEKEIKTTDLKDIQVENYVTLPDYKNLEVTIPEKVEVTDVYVKSYIQNRMDAVTQLHQITGEVQNGDVVNIDYAGTIDGTAFEGGTAQGQLLEIGSGSFIEGFEEGLIGVKVGETKDLSLQFPEDYRSADVAGKDCIFAVKVNYILTPLTDDNVSLVDEGYDNAETYREDARKMLEEYSDYQYERELKGNIAAALVQGSTYQDVPQSLIDDYEQDLREDLESAASAAGVTLEQYMMNTYYVAADSVESSIDSLALQCAREGLALQAIANQEGLSVTDEELDETLSELAAAQGYASAEEYLGEDMDKEEIRVNLLYDKVYNFLMENYQ